MSVGTVFLRVDFSFFIYFRTRAKFWDEIFQSREYLTYLCPFSLTGTYEHTCSNTVINFDSLRQEGSARCTLTAVRVTFIRGRFSGKQFANKGEPLCMLQHNEKLRPELAVHFPENISVLSG